MDKVKKFLTNNIISIVLVLITSIFSSGATYSSVQSQIKDNAAQITAVNLRVDETKTDITIRLDRIENKVDEIDRYLREDHNSYSKEHALYLQEHQNYLNAIKGIK